MSEDAVISKMDVRQDKDESEKEVLQQDKLRGRHMVSRKSRKHGENCRI